VNFSCWLSDGNVAVINSYAANVGYTDWAPGAEASDMEDIVRGFILQLWL